MSEECQERGLDQERVVGLLRSAVAGVARVLLWPVHSMQRRRERMEEELVQKYRAQLHQRWDELEERVFQRSNHVGGETVDLSWYSGGAGRHRGE